MSLNWKTVRAVDVAQACDLIASSQSRPRASAKAIFVVRDGIALPAKHVLRIAYCLANKLPLDTKLQFSSGDATINTLRNLGFAVERRQTATL
jgi:hypothetical protein